MQPVLFKVSALQSSSTVPDGSRMNHWCYKGFGYKYCGYKRTLCWNIVSFLPFLFVSEVEEKGMDSVATSKDPYAEVPIPRSPRAQEWANEWQQYALAVSTHSKKLIRKGGPDPSKWPKQGHGKGSLVVIGSGIKCVSQFTVEALGYLENADQVFYHVADPVTENYIRKINPNAKDLSVFYGNKKDRHETYIQMAEVMLYSVRRGQKVVTIYYGHPGIFVFASHRAIRIARKQGLQAKMLPGVSALDCLFADLGVDPSYPGLQVLEATDFLVRKRKILTDGHVIILQVGCVGDKGYRRKGYLMQQFHVLIEHLQSIYGADYQITHYIASQYPNVRPVIQRFPLSSLLDQDIRKKNITAISTFYIHPKDVRKTDVEMARKLGLQSLAVAERQQVSMSEECDGKPKEPTVQPKSKMQRDISKYGSKEQNSLKMLTSWSVPGAYDSTANTAAANFVASLAPDPNKMVKFTQNPRKVLEETPGILPWQARYLASGNRAMVRLAVKPNSSNPALDAAIALLTNNSFCRAYAKEAQKYSQDPNADKKLTAFLELHGFKTTPDAVQQALQKLQSSSLLPWRECYHTPSGILVIHCCNAVDNGQVIWNDVPIQCFTFSSSTLSWKAEGVNQSNAMLHFTSQNSLPLFNGKLWEKGESEPSTDNIMGTIENFISPLSVWRGNYRTVKLAQGSTTVGMPGPEFSISFTAGNPGGIVECGEKPVVNFQFNQKNLSWKTGEITFYSRKATASYPSVEKFYGYLWAEGESKPSNLNFWGTKDTTFLKPWSGKYKTYIGPAGKGKPAQELIVRGGLTTTTSTIDYGGVSISNFQFNNPVLSWKNGGSSAEICFEVFRDGTLGFKGMTWESNESKPSEANFEGVLDSIYLDAWTACYYTKHKEANHSVVDGTPFSITKKLNNKDYLIICNGEAILQWNYNGAKRSLEWSANRNSASGSIQFYIPPPEKGTGLRFFGKVWAKEESIPSTTNIWGSTVPFPGRKGNTTHQLEELLQNFLVIGLIELLKFAWKKFKRWLKSKYDGSSAEEQEKFKKEYEDAEENVDEQESNARNQDTKVDELDPEVDPSPEPPTPPDPPPEPPTNEVVDTDTDTADTDTDTDVDVDVDTDVDIVVDICSLM